VEKPDPDPEKAAAERLGARSESSLAWKPLVKRIVVVFVSGLAIYLVLPRVTEVFASLPRLSTLNWIWFVAAVAAETAHFGCDFALQRLALRTRGWFAVITAQLAGNAITNILPAGDAAGAAVQFRMLETSGIATDTAVGGLTAFSLLGIGGLLALPIFTLPAILFGAPVKSGLADAAYIGIGGFVLFAGFGVFVLATDRPLAWFGRAAQDLRNRIARRRPPLEDLDLRLVRERDTIRSVLGRKWRDAVLLSAGRLGFDYLCLLAALRATGSHPRPSLVLLAYAVAGVIGLVPITPGGLGIIEATLSALLVLSGVGVGRAVLATLTYRVAAYWLPLLAGPVAYAFFRRRYRTTAPDRDVGHAT
jgi:uncharacterized protein (TIRG00374 family)